jgi:hypothetical protein
LRCGVALLRQRLLFVHGSSLKPFINALDVVDSHLASAGRLGPPNCPGTSFGFPEHG